MHELVKLHAKNQFGLIGEASHSNKKSKKYKEINQRLSQILANVDYYDDYGQYLDEIAAAFE